MINLPDPQHELKADFPIYINSVGVQNVQAPFILESKFGEFYSLVSKISMSTDLSKEYKGISMSKLIRTLLPYLDKPLKNPIIKEILERFKTEVETNSKNSSIKFEFKLPIKKKAPRTDWVFPEYYNCSFEGKLEEDKFRFFQKVVIQYYSVCPCSASLCNYLEKQNIQGYPHAQRAFSEVLIEIIPPKTIWAEDIISLVEEAVKVYPRPILQRVDEMEIAKESAENLMFVEDAIRRIVNGLNKNNLIYDWLVKCIHEESIHSHEAVSVCWKGVQGGLNGSKFL